jgi:phosphoribosylaminoimidazole-succinocarboxamide synthase
MTAPATNNQSTSPTPEQLKECGLKHLYRGKVRDMYAAGDDHLLMVASDRISAYDVIMAQDIPQKGAVLNGVSNYWFQNTSDIIGNHCVSTDVTDFPCSGADDMLRGRAMLVTKTLPIRLECIVRGYLFGHGFAEYQETGSVHGVKYKPGMKLAEKLPEPIFSPTTKAEEGHDEAISPEDARKLVNADVYDFIRNASVALYLHGAHRAREAGIILADTKFEFGFVAGSDGALSNGSSAHSVDDIIVIDEVMTPDSSRYWEASTYEVGVSPASFDKQYLRDWLDSTGWDHVPPPPTLPDDVIAGTRGRYIEAYERITASRFSDWV